MTQLRKTKYVRIVVKEGDHMYSKYQLIDDIADGIMHNHLIYWYTMWEYGVKTCKPYKAGSYTTH